MRKFINEFKAFAVKGNMVDMGVGIVIGGAFSQIVNSFVKDIVMPPLGVLTGNVDFSEKDLVIKHATETTEQIAINYGLFVNNLINFLIIAVAIFIVIKQMNRIRDEIEKQKHKEEEKIKKETKPEVKQPSEETKLLTEIRDLLKSENKKD